MEFRTLLINLLDQLSEDSRKSFHFAVGHRVPRKDRDDLTHSGSLSLIDALLDRNVITEKNFDFLIETFQNINCHEAAAKLIEYKETSIQNLPSVALSQEATGGTTAPTDFDIDGMPMRPVPTNTMRKTSEISLISGQLPTELQSHDVELHVEADQQICSINSPESGKSISNTLKKSCANSNLFSKILIGVGIFTLIVSLILFSCAMYLFQRSNPSVNSPNNSQNWFYTLREGSQYGNTTTILNETFNDAKDLALTCVDRCIGVELHISNETLISVQFIYSNNKSSNLSVNQANNASVTSSANLTRFMLNSDEEINKINLYKESEDHNSNIIGIQCYTNRGRKTVVFGSDNGHFITESFESYTFAYARGIQQKNEGIKKLQFIWIKNASIQERLYKPLNYMLEMCEFTYIRTSTLLTTKAKGIETSWHDLKLKFNLTSPGCNLTASYYEVISRPGPDLFAVVNNESVFYNYQHQWHPYLTKKNLTCGLIPWPFQHP